jgi:capsular exopolysaccharide synthesis family protein
MDDAGLGLPDMFDAVRRRWLLTLLIALPIMIGVVGYVQTLPAKYQGKAVVALDPRTPAVSALEINVLAQKYVAYVTAPSTRAQVASALSLSSHALDNAVNAQVATSSVNLTITVLMRTPRLAADVANTLAGDAVSFSATDNLVRAAVVAPAPVPTSPAKPRRKLIDAAGIVVALLIGVIVAVLVERGRPRARTPMDVALITGHTVVGRIPKSRSVRGGVEAALADPAVGGAIRSLRTMLDHEGRSAPIRSLAVTSSMPDEGKTTTASTLAAAIARLDARVLLIDGDLRRAGLAKMFGLPGSPGLLEVLRDEVDLDSAIQVVRTIPGLSVLPTTTDPHLGDVLARNFYPLLQRALGEYDIVVIDSPPLLAGDDAGVLASQAGAVLLVVANGVDTRQLSEAGQALDGLRVRVIGVVMNRVRSQHYAYGYGTVSGSRVASS